MTSINALNAKGATRLFGVAAEFEDAEALLNAARKARDAGYEKMRAYTPYYVEGLSDILGHRSGIYQWVVLGGLLVGAVAAFYLQYYTDVIDYPLNIAGRALNNWQAFMILTFEVAILVAGLGVGVVMLVQNNFPLPYHPIFNAPGIEMASRSAFFLCIEVGDPRFDTEAAKLFLQGLSPKNVSEVPC